MKFGTQMIKDLKMQRDVKIKLNLKSYKKKTRKNEYIFDTTLHELNLESDSI